MKHILTSLFALLIANCSFAADWLTPDGMTKVMEGVDDGTYNVTLGHTFPYYGGNFTNAWMSTNGVIILFDPTTGFGNNQTGNSMCCSGQNLAAGNSWGNFSYMIAPLWTDLIDRNRTPDDGYYYQTDEGGSSFLWYDVNEFYNDNTNTFQVNMWPDGSFDFLYDEVDITQHSTFIGFTGSNNEVNQLGYYQGSVTEFDIDFHNETVNGGRAWYGSDGGYMATGPDCSNPLNDTTCPGYEQAYYDQQCNSNPLYDSGCPGYQNAIAVQNAIDDATGVEVFGDDISDFYAPPEPMALPMTTTTVEEEFFEEVVFEEVVVEEVEIVNESFEEEITPMEEVMGSIEQELPIPEVVALPEPIEVIEEVEEITVEPVAIAVEVEETVEETTEVQASRLDVMSIVMSQLAADDSFSQQQQQTSTFTSFDALDSAIEEVQIAVLTENYLTEETKDEVVLIETSSSTAGNDAGFSQQQDVGFSTGQSITAVLNNVPPNYSKFDVAPPAQQEVATTNKAAAQAKNMSNEQLEQNLEEFTDELQDSGGFSDQSLTIFLMGRVNGFDDYGGTLQDAKGYPVRNLPGGRVQNDRNSMLRLVGTDNRHEELVNLQYGR